MVVLIKKPLKVKNEILNKPVQNLFKTSRQNIQAQILSKQKIPHLVDFIKIYYLNQQNQKKYFLLNTYQKPNILPNLTSRTTRSILLVQGVKHAFFNKLL